ncbi:SapC family protein [Agaribacter flavus]|uniref:SapC family protein n=1 Tax=Agaribacter flavus TaxID=1902781 RepID=A0ABV7FTB7_9ALTE
MPNHQLLNNVTHHDIKILTDYAGDYGDNVGAVVTFPTEFGDVQKEYPIFFRQHPDTKAYQAVAMLGLLNDQNLFIQDGQWRANYIPAAVSRGPFAIGFQDQSAEGGAEKTPVIHIDLDHPRVNREKGHAVFLQHGGNSPYLEHISHIFTHMMDGMELGEKMIEAFTSLDLFEAVELELNLYDNEKHRLHGNYTISEAKLQALSADTLHQLHRAGFLQCAYLIRASMSNVQKLVNWQNQISQPADEAS